MTELQAGSKLQDGKYRIESVLGQGGFGITYLATTTTTMEGALGQMDVEIRVAIKEFFMHENQVRDNLSMTVSTPSEASREMVGKCKAKFIKEAQNLSRMNHPHIVRVADVFEENGTVYYVMRYLGGGSLFKYVRDSKDGHLSADEAIRYVRQIGSALQYMHSKCHVCHYDVKPSNIQLDDHHNAILIDFGLAKNYDANGQQTSTTPVGLSQGYAPLEQYQQSLGSFSPQSDIYSLGATLYFMLTGQVPPEASIINEDGLPSSPSYVSASLWQAVNVAMQPRRKDRPQSMEEWLAILDGEKTQEYVSTLLQQKKPQETVSLDTQSQTEKVDETEISVSTVPNPRKKPEESFETVVVSNVKNKTFSEKVLRFCRILSIPIIILSTLLFVNAFIGYNKPTSQLDNHGGSYIGYAKAPIPFETLIGHCTDKSDYTARTGAEEALEGHCLICIVLCVATIIAGTTALYLRRKHVKTSNVLLLVMVLLFAAHLIWLFGGYAAEYHFSYESFSL